MITNRSFSSLESISRLRKPFTQINVIDPGLVRNIEQEDTLCRVRYFGSTGLHLVDARRLTTEMLPLCVTWLHGYANLLKRLNTLESVNLHKCVILLDSCRIYATRCPAGLCRGRARGPGAAVRAAAGANCEPGAGSAPLAAT